jgi:hypothetical protein
MCREDGTRSIAAGIAGALVAWASCALLVARVARARRWLREGAPVAPGFVDLGLGEERNDIPVARETAYRHPNAVWTVIGDRARADAALGRRVRIAVTLAGIATVVALGLAVFALAAGSLPIGAG